MGRWRGVVGCGGGLQGTTRGFKAKGEGLGAGGSARRPSVGPEGSEGKCGIRGIRGIRGHHAGSGGAARGPGRWAMRGLSSGGLERRASLPYQPGLGGPTRTHGKTRGATQGDTRRVPGGVINKSLRAFRLRKVFGCATLCAKWPERSSDRENEQPSDRATERSTEQPGDRATERPSDRATERPSDRAT